MWTINRFQWRGWIHWIMFLVWHRSPRRIEWRDSLKANNATGIPKICIGHRCQIFLPYVSNYDSGTKSKLWHLLRVVYYVLGDRPFFIDRERGFDVMERFGNFHLRIWLLS